MRHLRVGSRRIGPGEPVYIVAELSANHGQDKGRALELVHAAKEAGADAVKLQTYTPDTMTIDCDAEPFRLRGGTIWDGRRLHELFGEAYTPWAWQPEVLEACAALGLDCFSTPFDPTAVDFLEGMDVALYKVASFELVDLPLLGRIAATGKPVIASTGMATLAEIDEAVRTLRTGGCEELCLLKCTSAYPAPPEDANLRTIPHLAAAFDVPAGLSDHTLEVAVPVAAVALGACVVEKHFTLSRSVPGPDSAFSLEPDELRATVRAIRATERALGRVRYEPTASEAACRAYRRSLFAVADIAAGEVFTEANVRSIRPADGLQPRHLDEVLGRRAARAIAKGTPLAWELLA